MSTHSGLRNHALAGVFLTAAALLPRSSPEEPPAEVARALQAGLQAVMRAQPEPSFAERAQRLDAVVLQTHDVTAIADATLGEQLDGLDPTAREALVATVGRWWAIAYGAALEGFEDADWTGLETSELGEGAVRITTALLREEGTDRLELALDLGNASGAWRIEKAHIDGEDLLGRMRDELAPVLASEGTAGVRPALEHDVTRYGETPTQTIERLQSALLEAMQHADDLGYEGRRALLDPVVHDTHDLAALAKLAAHGFWDELGTEQRVLFVETFANHTVATYAANFDGYSGERFERLGERELRRGVLVKSALIKTEGDRVGFDYLMRRHGGRWSILNIIVDGVSDLAIRRTEYADVFQRSGFTGLIAELEKQIRAYRSGEKD